MLVDEGRVTNIIYLDFCKVLDTALHNTLVSKLNRHDLTDRQQVRNRLEGCTQKGCGQQFNIQVECSDEWYLQQSVL